MSGSYTADNFLARVMCAPVSLAVASRSSRTRRWPEWGPRLQRTPGFPMRLQSQAGWLPLGFCCGFLAFFQDLSIPPLDDMNEAEGGKKMKRRARVERCQSHDNDFAASQRILHTRGHQRPLSSHTPLSSVTKPYSPDATPECVWPDTTVTRPVRLPKHQRDLSLVLRASGHAKLCPPFQRLCSAPSVSS